MGKWIWVSYPQFVTELFIMSTRGRKATFHYELEKCVLVEFQFHRLSPTRLGINAQVVETLLQLPAPFSFFAIFADLGFCA